jgi:hypothetical protein
MVVGHLVTQNNTSIKFWRQFFSPLLKKTKKKEKKKKSRVQHRGT